MAKIIFIYYVCPCILLFLAQVAARPPPVPDDEKNSEQELERYEKDNGQQRELDRHKLPIWSSTATEATDDLTVIYELQEQGIFRDVERRNLKKYHVRPNVFQRFIDKAKVSNGEIVE
ncbi:unnamed protein product [Allacma fusca]|uniref:Secreted protein n=1 Tax=Allacma fusca TaxID=39272 RepID=A0A8J2NUV6_9HEXA|nr:unnamed protein product [Allacma fusca]